MAVENQASPRIIRFVTEALLEILRDALSGILTPTDIDAAPPETIPKLPAGEQKVILYLYRVAESPTLKNQGPDYEVVSGGPGAPQVRIRRDPLTLNLHYLLVPYSGEDSFLETYDILGLCMSAFHDAGIFSPGEQGVSGLSEREAKQSFHLTKEPLTIDQLANIWEAVHEPYRLSVSYCVRTVQIESTLAFETQRVTERRFEVEQQ